MPNIIDKSIDLKKPVFLIGMMGGWKTTVGKKLAKTINLKFIDTDDEVQYRTSKTIVEIFKESGEAHFRKIESKVLLDCINEGNSIISTGGGIVLLPKNRSLLITQGYVIYLKVCMEVLINESVI